MLIPKHRFVYRVLVPHPIPAIDPVGVIQLESEGPDAAKVTRRRRRPPQPRGMGKKNAPLQGSFRRRHTQSPLLRWGSFVRLRG